MLSISFRSFAVIKLCLAAMILAVLTVASGAETAQAQQPPFDLSVDVEFKTSTRGWTFTAKNDGVEDAFGVTVRIDLPEQVIVGEADIPGSSEYHRSTVVWSVGRLDSGDEKTALIQTKLAQGVMVPNNNQGRLAVPARAVISSPRAEPPGLLYNNSAEAWGALTDPPAPVDYRPAKTEVTLQVGLDNPLPRDGDTINFTLQLYKTRPSGASTTAYGVRTRIQLPPGLGLRTATGADTFAAVPGQARTWEWYLETLRTINTRMYLAIPVTSRTEVDGECITAELTVERPADDPSNNTARVCFGEPSPALFQEGDVNIWTLYACKGRVATNACDTTDEVAVDVGVTVFDAFTDQYISFPGATAVIHVKDVAGRVFDADNGSVNDGNTVSWMTRTELDTDFTGTREGVKVGLYREPINDYINNWTDYQVTYRATGWNGGNPPGKISVRSATSGAALWPLAPENSWTYKRATMYSLSSISTNVTVRNVEFEKLGTYVVDMDVDMKHASIRDDDSNPAIFRGTGRTIFHVGPIAELEVRELEMGGTAVPNPAVPAGQRAFTVVAVNNGPDDAPAAQVTLTGLDAGSCTDDATDATEGDIAFANNECTWTIGELRTKEVLQGVYGRDGEILTIITSAAVGTEISAEIANTQDYQVCIDSSGNDVDAASSSACASPNTWHTAEYYDYIEDNNRATLRARRGTGEAIPAEGAKPFVALSWDAVDDVYGFPVSHYQVWRSECGTSGSC